VEWPGQFSRKLPRLRFAIPMIWGSRHDVNAENTVTKPSADEEMANWYWGWMAMVMISGAGTRSQKKVRSRGVRFSCISDRLMPECAGWDNWTVEIFVFTRMGLDTRI